MTITNLMPIRGIDNLSEDAALHQGGKEPFTFVRDAVNINVLPSGGIESRGGATRATKMEYKNLWQSPVHGDVFATLKGHLVKVYPDTWECDLLIEKVGEGDCYYLILNNKILIAAPNDIYSYDGAKAEKFTLDIPPAPYVSSLISQAGPSKNAINRYFAISWVKDGVESPLSDLTQFKGDARVVVPLPMPKGVSHANAYGTNAGGTQLQRLSVDSTGAPNPVREEDSIIGVSPPFENMSPMPSGRYLCYWRGRIITATANILRFSEPLAYHIHDELAGFVMMPQRVTFVQPVEGGIWVGQSDHVAFLQGDSLEGMSVATRSSHPPIEGSAIQIKANEAGEVSEGGQPCALWLASNGYVIGNSAGQMFETQGNRIGNISGQVGTSVILEKRIVTAVS